MCLWLFWRAHLNHYHSSLSPNNMTDNISRPYESTVHIALPSAQHAQQLKDVVSVDEEISNKVVKSFSIVTSQEAAAYEGNIDGGANNSVDKDGEGGSRRVLRM